MGSTSTGLIGLALNWKMGKFRISLLTSLVTFSPRERRPPYWWVRWVFSRVSFWYVFPHLAVLLDSPQYVFCTGSLVSITLSTASLASLSTSGGVSSTKKPVRQQIFVYWIELIWSCFVSYSSSRNANFCRLSGPSLSKGLKLHLFFMMPSGLLQDDFRVT